MDRDLADWREWMAYCDDMDAVNAIHDMEERFGKNFDQGALTAKPTAKVGPVCECGAAKCKTTHATWCPIYTR